MELKPCPFCGKIPKRFGYANAYRCEQCSKNSGWMSRDDWNTRTPDVAKLLEKLKEYEEREASIACAEIEQTANDDIAQRIVEENAKLQYELNTLRDRVAQVGTIQDNTAKLSADLETMIKAYRIATDTAGTFTRDEVANTLTKADAIAGGKL